MRLELAGVPAVYDTGVDDLPDGTRQLWLVMQLLRGYCADRLWRRYLTVRLSRARTHRASRGRWRSPRSYYVMNAVPLAARDADEAAKVMESRFVIAQLLASANETESAIVELRTVRPLLAAAYGPESAQVRNLDEQATRLQSSPGQAF